MEDSMVSVIIVKIMDTEHLNALKGSKETIGKGKCVLIATKTHILQTNVGNWKRMHNSDQKIGKV